MLRLERVEPSTISPHTQLALQYMAIEGWPNEVCGVIYTHGIVVQYPNTFCGDKTKGFDMEIDIVDDIRAIWHSHPGGMDHPSADDIPCIELLAQHGFTFHHVIVTPKAVHEFEARIDNTATPAA